MHDMIETVEKLTAAIEARYPNHIITTEVTSIPGSIHLRIHHEGVTWDKRTWVTVIELTDRFTSEVDGHRMVLERSFESAFTEYLRMAEQAQHFGIFGP